MPSGRSRPSRANHPTASQSRLQTVTFDSFRLSEKTAINRMASNAGEKNKNASQSEVLECAIEKDFRQPLVIEPGSSRGRKRIRVQWSASANTQRSTAHCASATRDRGRRCCRDSSNKLSLSGCPREGWEKRRGSGQAWTIDAAGQILDPALKSPAVRDSPHS